MDVAQEMIEKLQREGMAQIKAMTPEAAHELQSRMTWMAFATALPQIARAIRANNEAKGFGKLPPLPISTEFDEVRTWCKNRLDATAIGLIHGEVSEMMEARRRPGWENTPSEHIPDFTALVEEGADVLIRLLDLFERLGLMQSLVAAVPAKIAFNMGRPFKHGRTF